MYRNNNAPTKQSQVNTHTKEKDTYAALTNNSPVYLHFFLFLFVTNDGSVAVLELPGSNPYPFPSTQTGTRSPSSKLLQGPVVHSQRLGISRMTSTHRSHPFADAPVAASVSRLWGISLVSAHGFLFLAGPKQRCCADGI